MLACSMEIVDAIRSGDPAGFVSNLPVHQVRTAQCTHSTSTQSIIHSIQDGSCNGLQHYAALGQDQLGAEQVGYNMHSTKATISVTSGKPNPHGASCRPVHNCS